MLQLVAGSGNVYCPFVCVPALPAGRYTPSLRLRAPVLSCAAGCVARAREHEPGCNRAVARAAARAPPRSCRVRLAQMFERSRLAPPQGTRRRTQAAHKN